MAKVLCLAILVFCVNSAASIQYVPPNQEVEVEQGGSYRIGVEDILEVELTKCHFISDTGLHCSFEIWPTRSNATALPVYCNGESYAHDNIVTERGREGLCQITVDMVQDTGPRQWTLIAENFNNEVVINNIFEINLRALPLNGSLLETYVQVYEGETFINYMNLKSGTKLISCTLHFEYLILDLDLNSNATNATTSYLSEKEEEVSNRVSSVGNGMCGIKYRNATIQYRNWFLMAADDEENLYRGNFTTIIKQKVNLDKKQGAVLGEKFNIQCGGINDVDFCYLYNPSAELVKTENCRYEHPVFTMEDVGFWICQIGNPYSLETTDYKIEMVTKKDTTVVTWVNETNSYINIGCRVAGYNADYGMTSCRMIRPNLEVLNVRPSRATDRYQALGTDYKKGVCTIQISKPLEEFENGMWQCQIFKKSAVIGRYIAVNNTNDVEYPKDIKVLTRLGEPLPVSCNIPYASEFCSIDAPDGRRYLEGPDILPGLGKCSVTITKSTKYDNGVWKCSFAQKIGVPDDTIHVEVSVVEIVTYEEQVPGHLGGITKLMCHTNDLPLEYCRYTNPKGETYHIHDHGNSTSLSYYGRGIEYGDCGIIISNTQKDDFGSWTCALQIVGSYEMTRPIYVIDG